MLSKRIIACLDVRDGSVVKGVNFEGLRRAGDPAELAARYNVEGIDELVILDVTATIEGRRALAATIREVSAKLFIPLAVGGGIRTEADAATPAPTRSASTPPRSRIRRSLPGSPTATAARPSSSPSTPSALAIGSMSTHAAAACRRAATPSTGRQRPSAAAPARSC
jgi:histidine biosynthesis protein